MGIGEMIDLFTYLEGKNPNIYNQEYRVRNLETLWPYLFYAKSYLLPHPDSILLHPRTQCLFVYGDVLKDSTMLK